MRYFIALDKLSIDRFRAGMQNIWRSYGYLNNFDPQLKKNITAKTYFASSFYLTTLICLIFLFTKNFMITKKSIIVIELSTIIISAKGEEELVPPAHIGLNQIN